jgi:hypothetical protein
MGSKGNQNGQQEKTTGFGIRNLLRRAERSLQFGVWSLGLAVDY